MFTFDQKNRQRICCKTRDQVFETLNLHVQSLGYTFEALKEKQ